MIAYEEARSIVLDTAKPLLVERLPLDKLLHRVLAENIVTPFPLPRFDNSSVDGYALRSVEYRNASVEAPIALSVLNTIHAGDDGKVSLPVAKAFRIMTGAPVPAGVDAVIMREEVESADGFFIRRPVRKGENIRFRGEELPEGATVLASGTVVTPPVVGMLATLGISAASVYESPRVTVIVTGDELRPVGERLAAGQIYDANGPALVAALRAIGIKNVRLRFALDNISALRKVVNTALSHSNVIITVGGVSVGDRDYIREVSRELGVRELFWRVAIKPGKPLYYGVAEAERQTLFFGLPGNPVAALVTFDLFVKPAIRQMMGYPAEPDLNWAVRLTTTLRKQAGRLEFVRGFVTENGSSRSVVPVKGQESHMLSGLAAANCLIVFPKDETVIEAGTVVEIMPLHWGTV